MAHITSQVWTLRLLPLSSSHFCRRCLSQSIVNFGAKPDRNVMIDVDPVTKDQLRNRGEKPQNHSGSLPRIGFRDLPVDLNIALNRVLVKFQSHKLRKDAIELKRILRNRKPQIQGKELRERAKNLERQLLSANQMELRPSQLSEEERIALRKAITDKISPVLQSQIYHWTPINYNQPYLCAQYILARFPEEYTVLLRILSEIRQRRPDFQPSTLFDFGSGVGSATFAANAVFGENLGEYVCVDNAPAMKETLMEINQNGTDGEKPLVKNLYARTFLPGSHDRKFDLVICAFTLMDFPTISDRLKAIRSLWMKTKGFLVLVEQGTSAGYQMIMEARDHILQLDKVGKKRRKSDELEQKIPEAKMFSPCPHTHSCPRLADAANKQHACCRFAAPVRQLPFMGIQRVHNDHTDFSYAVFQKTDSDTQGVDVNFEPDWPRVVEKPIIKGQRSILRMCCPDGKLRELTATKGRHSSYLFPLAKHTKWGDRLPVTMEDQIVDEAMKDITVFTSEMDGQDGDLREDLRSIEYEEESVTNAVEEDGSDSENDEFETNSSSDGASR